MERFAQPVLAELLQRDQPGVLGCLHHHRQRAGVVHLYMIRHHVVDIGKGHELFYPRFELAVEGGFDRVYQGHLFIDDEVGVICSAHVRGVAVEVPDIPVDGAYPVDAFSQFCLTQVYPLRACSSSLSVAGVVNTRAASFWSSMSNTCDCSPPTPILSIVLNLSAPTGQSCYRQDLRMRHHFSSGCA